MRLKLMVIAIIILATGMACKKKSNAYAVKGDYMIVGHAGGFAGNGTPAVYYLISNGELRKDASHTSGNVPDNVAKFNFTTLLPHASYMNVADLKASIPAELLTQNNTTIGRYTPDAGYTDVRALVNGIACRWQFEQDQSKSSAAVQQFVARVNSIY